MLPDLEQSADLRAAAPILVLLPTRVASRRAASIALADDADPMILGLGLMGRAVLASRRAGFGQAFLLSDNRAAPPGIVAIESWQHVNAVFASSRATSLVIAPAAILAETSWLERLARIRIEPADWATTPDRIVMLAASAVSEALALLDEEGGAHSLTAVQSRLARRFGSPAALPDRVDPLVVVTRADIGVAEGRLLHALVKDTDGFMARHVERPISLLISRHLASTGVTPNQITLVSVAIGVAGAPFFLSAQWPWQTVGALLFLAHSIVDGCDGELARLRFQESRLGGVLDFWGDNVVHIVIFACMAVGWSWAAGEAWPLLLGAAAVLGSLGSASFVYWRVMRIKDDSGPLFTSVSTAPDRRLARLLDSLSRRDFIYLVVVLALFGKSSWFLLLASLGAPMFFFLLIFLTLRERLPKILTSTGA